MFELFWSTLCYIFPCISKRAKDKYILDDEYIFDDDNDFDINKLKIKIPK
jgi:hypothetical protein